MVSERMLGLGTSRSVIRELFEYGKQRAAVVGKENVFDFSIGNPSVPAPPEVNQIAIRLLQEEDPPFSTAIPARRVIPLCARPSPITSTAVLVPTM